MAAEEGRRAALLSRLRFTGQPEASRLVRPFELTAPPQA